MSKSKKLDAAVDAAKAVKAEAVEAAKVETAAEKALAAKIKRSPLMLCEGVTVTSLRGVLSSTDEIVASDFAHGEATLAALKERKNSKGEPVLVPRTK